MGNTAFELYDLESLQRWQNGEEDNSERLERLRRNLTLALRELTPTQRRQVEMYYFQHMKQTEIARELGVNKSTVSRGLTRAKRRLRRYLQYSL